MKKFCITTILLFSVCFVFAQKFSYTAEAQWYTSKTTTLSPLVYIEASKEFTSSKFGMSITTAVAPGYVELFAGPTYKITTSPSTYVDLAVGVGLETAHNPYRIASYAYLYSNSDTTGTSNKGAIQALVNIEYGGSGYWYVAYATYNLTTTVALGIHGQAYEGTWGPRIQYSKKNITLYTVPGRSLEKKEYAVVLGLQCTF